MAKERIAADWVEINPETLSTSLNAAYQTYKDAYRVAKEYREAFEREMQRAAELPDGKRLVFGYNFGKLSMAVVDDDRKPKVASKSSQSLSAFLASQQAAGKRC